MFVSEFLICITLWGVIGSALHYTTNLCSMKNSPLTIGIAHSFKDIFTMTFSIILFKDIQITNYMLIGFFISLVGSSIYTYQKYKDYLLEN
jgi:hypothetical protein